MPGLERFGRPGGSVVAMDQAGSEGKGMDAAPKGPNTNGIDGLPTGSLRRMADGRATS